LVSFDQRTEAEEKEIVRSYRPTLAPGSDFVSELSCNLTPVARQKFML